jgi:hypothetical protein
MLQLCLKSVVVQTLTLSPSSGEVGREFFSLGDGRAAFAQRKCSLGVKKQILKQKLMLVCWSASASLTGPAHATKSD